MTTELEDLLKEAETIIHNFKENVWFKEEDCEYMEDKIRILLGNLSKYKDEGDMPVAIETYFKIEIIYTFIQFQMNRKMDYESFSSFDPFYWKWPYSSWRSNTHSKPFDPDDETHHVTIIEPDWSKLFAQFATRQSYWLYVICYILQTSSWKDMNLICETEFKYVNESTYQHPLIQNLLLELNPKVFEKRLIGIHLWHLLPISSAMLCASIFWEEYEIFSRLIDIVSKNGLNNDKNPLKVMLELVDSCLQNRDQRYIERLSQLSIVLKPIILSYINYTDPECVFSDDGIIEEIMEVDQLQIDINKDPSKRTRMDKIYKRNLQILHPQLGICYSLIAKSIPVQTIELHLKPVIEAIEECTGLMPVIADLIMGYLFQLDKHQEKIDSVLHKLVKDVYSDKLILPQKRIAVEDFHTGVKKMKLV